MPRRVAERIYFVYIMASQSGVLYTGVTNDLERRVSEHKDGSVGGFTSRYRVTRLVYFEEFGEVLEAIAREKQIKSWSRKKKLDLVVTLNPKWRDLGESWVA